MGHESFVKHTLILANLVEGGVALADWPKEAAVSGLDPGLEADERQGKRRRAALVTEETLHARPCPAGIGARILITTDRYGVSAGTFGRITAESGGSDWWLLDNGRSIAKSDESKFWHRVAEEHEE